MCVTKIVFRNGLVFEAHALCVEEMCTDFIVFVIAIYNFFI